MERKVDMRILRTRKAIKDAFLGLMEAKGYDRITVQDIADEAFINRNTFYLHYLDKEDLMRKLTAEAIEILDEHLSQRTIDLLNEESIHTLIHDVLNLIQQNRQYYQIMMHNSGSTLFIEELKAFMKHHMYQGRMQYSQEHPIILEQSHMQICMEYITSGMLGIINFCLKEDIDFTTEHIADLTFSLLYENVLTLLQG
jgi:AcrR family transcriptional regulator